MRRRDFLNFSGGAVATWLPLVVHAQQSDRVRLVGVLNSTDADDDEGKIRYATFLESMKQLGWIDGRNMRIEARWPSVSEAVHRYAAELISLAPDVILAAQSAEVAALREASRNVPIVFANVIDPVGAGFVTSLNHPGGNATGFAAFEYGISGKWLEFLKQTAPGMTRVAVIRDPALAAGIGQFAAIQSAAASSGVELSAIDPRDVGDLERAITAFAREPNGGLIVTASQATQLYREHIIALAKQFRLPNIYPFRYYPSGGGLASYGPDPIESFRRAAGYVDRILQGEKPADLPVQAPTKYLLVINLKTAKALGLTVPDTLLSTADEVIE